MAFRTLETKCTLKCIDTNEGDARRYNPEHDFYYPDDAVIVNGESDSANWDGFDIAHLKRSSGEGSSGEGIMISFAGVKNNDLIGTLKRGHLEVLPKIGCTINRVETSRIPDSYSMIPMTGLYVDTNKVEVLFSKLLKIDGIEHTKVTSLFHDTGPKVETIIDGVCGLCLQKTNHSRDECPSGDLSMRSNKNHGPMKEIPIEMNPPCKENALDNGLRFHAAPEGADEDELQAKFEEYGKVKRLLLIRDSETGSSRRSGFVFFVNIDDAERALNALKDQFYMYWLVKQPWLKS